MLGLPALLAFLSFALAGYAGALMLERRAQERQALANRLRMMAGTSGNAIVAPLLKDQRLSSIPILDAILGAIPTVKPIVRMIRQAGLKRRVGEVLLYIPLLATIAFLVTSLIGYPLLMGVVAAVIAGSIPLIVVNRIRAKRIKLFGEQLPEGLDLVRSALQAGHGFLSALNVVAETFPDPISQELRWVSDEVRLGLPLRDALYHLVERVADPNLPILVVGVLVAQEVGGNLAEVIDNITYTIRERSKLMREMQVMTAQGRLSGLVLTVLPFLLGGFLLLTNQTYFAPMIETTTGHYMLLYVVVSILVGHLAIRRIVNIQV